MSDSAISYKNQRLLRAACALLLALIIAACVSEAGHRQDALEHQLMAEIAFQRGEYYAAAGEYLQLAQQSRVPDHARRATEMAYEFGYDAYALQGASLWAQVEPDNLVAHAYLGRMYLRRNRLSEAFRELSLGMGPAADREDTDYVGMAAELGGDVPPRRALRVFEMFAESEPERAGVQAGLATLAGLVGDLDRSVAASRATVQLVPEWTMARVWLSRYLLINGDQSSAFEQMAFALEMNPGLEMELEFVELLALADEEDDARDRLERLEERFPDDPNVLRIRAILAIEWQDYDLARADFMRLLAEAWFVNESFWYLGDIAYRQSSYLQALRYFERVSGGTWFVSARNAISRTYLALGDGDTALAVQRELAADYPKEYVNRLRTQAEILVTMGRVDDAIELANEVIEYKPWDERNILFLGGLQESAGREDDALGSFRKARKMAPDNPVALNALGYTLANAGKKYREAEKLILEALEYEPRNGAYLDSLGWLRYRQGNLSEALRLLESAYAETPDPEIGAHLGEVLWEMGRQDDAVNVWAGALTRFPDNAALNATTERYLR